MPHRPELQPDIETIEILSFGSFLMIPILEIKVVDLSRSD